MKKGTKLILCFQAVLIILVVILIALVLIGKNAQEPSTSSIYTFNGLIVDYFYNDERGLTVIFYNESGFNLKKVLVTDETAVSKEASSILNTYTTLKRLHVVCDGPISATDEKYYAAVIDIAN